MKKAWKWITEHWQAVLGGIGALFVGWLAWGAYNRHVGKLKDAIEVEKAVSKVKQLEAKSAELKKQGQKAAQKDAEIEKQIATVKEKAVKVREDVKNRSAEQIADRFNQLYRR